MNPKYQEVFDSINKATKEHMEASLALALDTSVSLVDDTMVTNYCRGTLEAVWQAQPKCVIFFRGKDYKESEKDDLVKAIVPLAQAGEEVMLHPTRYFEHVQVTVSVRPFDPKIA